MKGVIGKAIVSIIIIVLLVFSTIPVVSAEIPTVLAEETVVEEDDSFFSVFILVAVVSILVVVVVKGCEYIAVIDKQKIIANSNAKGISNGETREDSDSASSEGPLAKAETKVGIQFSKVNIGVTSTTRCVEIDGSAEGRAYSGEGVSASADSESTITYIVPFDSVEWGGFPPDLTEVEEVKLITNITFERLNLQTSSDLTPSKVSNSSFYFSIEIPSVGEIFNTTIELSGGTLTTDGALSPEDFNIAMNDNIANVGLSNLDLSMPFSGIPLDTEFDMVVKSSIRGEAAEPYKIDITNIGPEYQEVLPGDTATFIIRATNLGLDTDTVQLTHENFFESGGCSWTVDLSKNSVTLDPDAYEDVILSVTADSDCEISSRKKVKVTGTSQNGLYVSDTISDSVIKEIYVVPEFTTIAIPVAVILGLMFNFRERE